MSFQLGVLLVIIGVLLLVLSFVLRRVSIGKDGKKGIGLDEVDEGGGFSGGGVVMLGPFPIVLGTDSSAVKIAVVGALFLMVLWFCFVLVFWLFS
ncbi:putative membrane protein DUF131 family [Methanonatronarchaeum thermophilum]|uniref:Putative membrane protein DUF131 family n=1 Tax=Methanonatronarchaeum thermophilum TaxID=1927129 RepID=A0A1Y3GCT7_9EURY|nr:putative membrane protein DUF131 family [Methanonatronarchaeum thermophilum]